MTDENGIICADTATVNAVIANLHATFEGLTSGGFPPETYPRLPTSFEDEDESCEPLAHLLYKIITTDNSDLFWKQFVVVAESNISERKERWRRFLKNLKLVVLDELDYYHDMFGSDVALAMRQLRRIMDRQSGAYDRYSLFANQRRYFRLGIGFQYDEMPVEAHIFVFHHGGLSSYHPLKVSTAKDFNGLVEHIVSILSITDDFAYGLDPTRTQDLFYINGRLYKSVSYLCVRGNLLGPSTIVHRLDVAQGPADPNMKTRWLTLSGENKTLPDKLTYKLTYQIKGRSQESQLLSEFRGRFGIADVLGYYVCAPGDPHSSTSRLFNNAEFWSLFPQKSRSGHSSPNSEDRILQCIAFPAEGKALLDVGIVGGVPSPSELLESILHAIIGHYILFKEGILHRDINYGNVLRYAEPIRRPALEKFECTKSVDRCRGFLIDGDHAVEWRKSSSSQTISGTMPFMSLRLLRASQAGKAVIHTALDDLESFLWLLIWCIGHASKNIPGAKDVNRGIQLMLDAWKGNEISNLAKISVAKDDWTDAVFGDLVKEWLNIFRTAKEDTSISKALNFLPSIELNNEPGSLWIKACNWLETKFTKIYEAILKSGLNHLKDIEKYSNWKEVVDANLKAARAGHDKSMFDFPVE